MVGVAAVAAVASYEHAYALARRVEVTVDGRILTIRAERRQQDDEPCHSEFRYGSLARQVRLPAKVDAADVTAKCGKGSSRSASRPARSTRKAPGSPSLTPTRRLSSRLTRPDKGPARAGRGCVIGPRTELSHARA